MTITADPLEKLRDKTSAERAYRQLRQDILGCVFVPGQKLKIDMLKERYGLGGGPLREALARLAGDHLVDLLGQRGFVVAAMSVKEALEIVQLRQMLEVEALTQSLARGDAAWERRLTSAYDGLAAIELDADQSLGRIAEWEERNREFHDALVAACPSEWLLKVRAMLYHQHTRYRLFARIKIDSVLDVHAEHKALFEAALRRDRQRIVPLIEAHVMRSNDNIARAIADLQQD